VEFTEDPILQIQALCPAIEQLAITVMRDKSSESETAIYKCFRTIESLRYLHIILNCANYRIGRDPTYDPQFKGEDQEPADKYSSVVKKGNVREALINCAVDKKLACSIWETITKNKTSKRLEQLKLWTRTGVSFFPHSNTNGMISRELHFMARSWLIERSPRDDTKEITVKELLQHAREDYELQHGWTDPVHNEVFHSIWPQKEDSRNWWNDWSSFPLEG